MPLRVIAGEYKGRKLFAPKDDRVRPTADRVKEAIFSMAQPWILDSVCIDLFAGSGSLGIEALSRGAAFVYFVDISRESLALVKQNLNHVGSPPDRSALIGTGWKAAVARIAETVSGAELVFVDAPYALCEYYSEILGALAGSGILAEEALIFIERDGKADAYLDELPDGMAAVRVKRYGNTVVDMIRYESEDL
ncbi:RNA methyltransferase [Clostridia bacterium]|nr:RNA methyltransferase [Clostridia bacterium]